MAHPLHRDPGMTKLMIIILLGPTFAMADSSMGPPSQIATAKQKANLENAIKRMDPGAKTVTCQQVIVVPIARGSTATAGACELDGSELEMACKNDAIGAIQVSVRRFPEMTLESELRKMIAEECIGAD